MISKRQFFSIFLIMATVFLLFQGTQVGKEYWEQEQPNPNAVETGLRQDTVWVPPKDPQADERSLGFVACLFSETSPEGKAAARWARYAKRVLVFVSSPSDPACAEAELLLVPGDALTKNASALDALLAKGGNVLCLSLPPVEQVRADKNLQALLGIRSIRSASVPLEGLHVFSGFLLGGERMYRPADEEEAEKRQDLPPDAPWYIVRAGTETYMRGILTDEDALQAEAEDLKNEDLPALLWRHHRGQGEIFAVNGPYLEDPTILGGVVQAVLSKLEPVSLYPVLDAQVFSLVDFPALSDENSDVLLPLYGRKMTDITRNIILPSLVSLPNRYGVAITAFAAPQSDYSDAEEPRKDVAEQMRKELHVLRGELALSLRHRDEVPLEERLSADAAALAREDSPVEISAVWSDPEELDALAAAETPDFLDLHTVLTLPEDDETPLDYLSDSVTVQRVTGDAVSHTYMDDLRLLCRETSMGYDSCYCDLGSVWRPETDDDLWQKRAVTVFSNLITYRKPFSGFSRVTASACDAKLRRYLMADYDYSRQGDELVLVLTFPLPLTEASFVLRLNGETIAEMQGGSWTQLEDGAFLLRVTASYVHLHLEPAEPLASLSESEEGAS